MNNSHALPGSREFLAFLKTKFSLIHNSNFFFRDLQYGVMAYLASRGKHAGYTRSERIAREIAEGLEREGIFKKVDHQSWCVNYPEFALPRVEKTAAPAAGA
jgi:hypothetical protein